MVSTHSQTQATAPHRGPPGSSLGGSPSPRSASVGVRRPVSSSPGGDSAHAPMALVRSFATLAEISKEGSAGPSPQRASRSFLYGSPAQCRQPQPEWRSHGAACHHCPSQERRRAACRGADRERAAVRSRRKRAQPPCRLPLGRRGRFRLRRTRGRVDRGRDDPKPVPVCGSRCLRTVASPARGTTEDRSPGLRLGARVDASRAARGAGRHALRASGEAGRVVSPENLDGGEAVRQTTQTSRVDAEGPLTLDELRAIDAYWRAANYLSVGLIYLHVNRAIRERDLNAIYVTGPGHGGPAVVANAYLEGTYSELYPNVACDEAGLKELFRQFSFPGGIPSHAAPETPGSIHEGGELGYSLAHAFGA